MATQLTNTLSARINKPLTCEEVESLKFSPDTVRRVRVLLQKEANGTLTTIEAIQLDGFKEAAFFNRLGNRQ